MDYGAIDLHKRYTWIRLITADGAVTFERRVALPPAAQADPIVRRLQTAPGVGPITALTFRAVLDEVGRFADARSVAAYLGLVPKEDSSGARQRKGAITKSGPTGLTLLVTQPSLTVNSGVQIARCLASRTDVVNAYLVSHDT